MGNWNISINGIGQHHNGDKERDADELAKKLVLDLVEAGQSVTGATFTNGSTDDMMPKPDREPMGDTAAYEKGFADAEAKHAAAHRVGGNQ